MREEIVEEAKCLVERAHLWMMLTKNVRSVNVEQQVTDW